MDSTTSTPDSKAKVTYDPGWNDPPQFSYNAQQPTPGRPRNFLNKRVAFPLSNATSSPSQAAPMSLPPMPVAPLIPSLPLLQAQPQQNPDEIDIDSENTLKEVKDILLQFLERSSELGPKANDIKRRLGVMEDMWRSGKLNKRIHLKMKELACVGDPTKKKFMKKFTKIHEIHKALRDDVPSKADDLHRALMVDHVSSVGTWMPGVKQLIHHCIARSELLAIDKDHPDDAEH